MFVIKRSDKDYGNFSKTHEKLDEAIEEARRLARKHAFDKPEFIIYKLEKVKTVKSDILTFVI